MNYGPRGAPPSEISRFISSHCYPKTKTNMLVATNKTCWPPAGCEASFSQRSLGKSVQCYPSESSCAARIICCAFFHPGPVTNLIARQCATFCCICNKRLSSVWLRLCRAVSLRLPLARQRSCVKFQPAKRARFFSARRCLAPGNR